MRFTDQCFDVRTLHRLGERAVEISQHLPPVHIAVLDLVEVRFHVRSEFDVEDIGETLHHYLLDLFAELCREESSLLELCIAAVDQRRHDRRIR